MEKNKHTHTKQTFFYSFVHMAYHAIIPVFIQFKEIRSQRLFFLLEERGWRD